MQVRGNRKDGSCKEMVFTYRKSKSVLELLFCLLMIGMAVYVLNRGIVGGTTTILTWVMAIMLSLLAFRCLIRIHEKIILDDNQIAWVRFFKTTKFPLTQIINIDSYVPIDRAGLEIKSQSGQKIRFTTEIIGFHHLCREVMRHHYNRLNQPPPLP